MCRPATQPMKTQPMKTQPMKTQPMKTQPTKTQPIKTQPTKTQPIKTQPKVTSKSETTSTSAGSLGPDDGAVQICSLNLVNANYLWVNFTGTDVTVLTLIDSGAQVSLIPKHVYEKLPRRKRAPLQPTEMKIAMGNGNRIEVYGRADIAFEFQGLKFQYGMYVVEDSVQPLLGYDFLRDTGDAHISPSEHSVTIMGKKLQLHSKQAVKVTHKVTINRTTVVQQGGEVIVEASVRGKGEMDGRMSLLEPANSIFAKTGAMVCRVATTPCKSKVPVRVYNPLEEPIVIYKNTTIGVLREIDETVAWCDSAKTDAEDDEGADDVADSLHGLYADPDERQEEEEPYCEIRQFGTLPTTADGATDFDRVPEHLQQLYETSIKALNQVQRRSLRRLLVEYEDVFARNSKDIGRARDVKHHIDTQHEEPVHQRPRHHPKAHTEVIRKNVETLAEAGIIRPSTSEWASNVVLAKKKDGTWRMCVDYRELNLKTKNKGTYMLPRIDETLDSLGRAKYFCSLDVIQGYHHVELTDESKAKTAFHAPRCSPAHWEYNFMPFGLVGAPRTFQRMMDRILRGLEYRIALAYLDDIIIYGVSVEECLANLRTVFERIRHAGLKLKPSKCSLFQEETMFLGYVISADGIRTDPKKVQAIAEMAPCRSVRDVQTFMGMCQYYAKFVPKFQEIALPIQELLKKGVKFKWTVRQQKAFDTLKDLLMKAPILSYPKDDCKYVLDTDASDYALGGVLNQLQPNKSGRLEEKVIAYYSKRFDDTERHYCARRRELLAIVRSVKHFDSYLRGQDFTIRTDHASLRFIKTMKELPSQFHRWVMALEEYTYTIEIRRGVLHGNADGLSRMPCLGKKCICVGVDELERTGDCSDRNEADAVISSIRFQPKYTMAEMAAAQSTDPHLAALYRAKVVEKQRPVWNAISGESPAAKAYVAEWKRIEVHDNVMYRRWENDDGTQQRLQLLLPFRYQRELCRSYHDTSNKAHLGRRRCYTAIQLRFFWHKMNDDIRWWIRTCDICQRRKRPQPTPKAPMKMYVTGAPGERVSMDIIGPIQMTERGNQYILTMTDHFSRFAQAFPMPDKTAKSVAALFTQRWCEQFGEPMQIHSDQGQEFEAHVLKQIADALDIEKTRTVAFHPAADGMVERYNQTIVDCISKLVENTKDWDLVVAKCASAYNGTIHASTGFTPNKLWFGRELFHSTDLMMPTPEQHNDVSREQYVKKWEDDMRLAYQTAREAIGRSVRVQKKYYDRTSHLVMYKEGDSVMLKDFSPKVRGERKLAPKWIGPYYILDAISDVNFRIIRSPDDKPKVVHHDRLKPYYARELLDIQWVLRRSKTYKSAGGDDVTTAPDAGDGASAADAGAEATTGVGRPRRGRRDPPARSEPAEATARKPRGRPKRDPGVPAVVKEKKKKETKTGGKSKKKEPATAPPAGRGRGRGRPPTRR